MVNLRDRCLQPEIMDQPDLDEAEHQRALRGLRRVNSFSFASRVFWPAILRQSRRRKGRAVRVLDLACGGGDVGIGLAIRAARSNVDIQVAGWDISEVAVKAARDQVDAAGYDNLHFVEANVINDPLPTDFDIVMCSLFLHHLEQTQAVALLKKMAAATQGQVLVNDLRRTRTGYWLAWFGCRMLTTSPIVRYDGPTSVAGAFTIDEALQMANEAGLVETTITSFWPERFLLAWSRS